MLALEVQVTLDWCSCIDDKTRIDFAHQITNDIAQKYNSSEPITLISLGSGALKQEELITKLLLDQQFTHVTLVLIDSLYTYSSIKTVQDIEQEIQLFESTGGFEKLGDLYLSLEKTDDPVAIKNTEAAIELLEKEIEIEQYIKLCDQQTTLLHSHRIALLNQLLTAHAPNASIVIQSFNSVAEYLKESIPQNCVILFIDADTRTHQAKKQREDFEMLRKLPALVYQL